MQDSSINIQASDYPFDYAVAAMPRSGTGWLANMLTWGPSFCWHEASTKTSVPNAVAPIEGNSDPMYSVRPDLLSGSCRTILVTRPIDELIRSAANLPIHCRLNAAQVERANHEFMSHDWNRFDDLMLVEYKRMFEPGYAMAIWEFATRAMFMNPHRIYELCRMNVQSQLEYTPENIEAASRNLCQ